MSIWGKTGRAPLAGIGLLVAFAALIGCASVDPVGESGQASEESIGQLSEPIGEAGIFRCTMGGGFPATLVIRPDETCHRYPTRLPGASGRCCFSGACPSCWTLARDLECVLEN